MEMVRRIRDFLTLCAHNLLLFLFKQSINPSLPQSPQPPPIAPAASLDPESLDVEMMPLEETQTDHPLTMAMAAAHNKTPAVVVDLGKTILEFCFMTAVALITLSFQTHFHLSSSFYVFCVLILLAFASSLAGILFHMRLPTAAGVLEQMAIIFGVLAFFMAMAMSINPPVIKWVTWVICALSFVSFFIYYRINK